MVTTIDRLTVTSYVIPTALDGLRVLRDRAPAGMEIAAGEYGYHLVYVTRITSARHVEYVFDHGRIDAMLFDGALAPRKGVLCPDFSWPGLGLELKRQEAA